MTDQEGAELSSPPRARWYRAAIAITVLFAVITILGIARYRHGAEGSAMKTTPSVKTDANPLADAESEPPPKPVHVPMPQEVRGVYWTAQSAGGERGRELIEYMKRYGLNSAVIDLKMDDGELAFEPQAEELKTTVMKHPAIPDLDGLLRDLADEQIYRIARIAVMRDAAFADARPNIALRTKGGGIWHDKIGSVWLDPAAPEVAQYNIRIAIEAYERGFDEIQFDYVRFPSDGAIGAITYPVWGRTTSTKVEAMQTFFETVGSALKENGVTVSFDVFGMTFISTSDFNIGQRLPDVFDHADIVSPMAYPSHYPDMFRGYPQPALVPYDIVKLTLDEGAYIMKNLYGVPESQSRPKFRPWIQDFDIGAVYTAHLIEEEIRAARDAGASGWILWNARNVYEPAAYLPPKTTGTEQTP